LRAAALRAELARAVLGFEEAERGAPALVPELVALRARLVPPLVFAVLRRSAMPAFLFLGRASIA
jgi:hypothetical protein